MALAALVVLQFVHLAFAMAWLGGGLYYELVVLRQWPLVTNAGRARLFVALMTKSGPYFGISSVGTLVSGVLYFPIRYGSAHAAPLSFPAGVLIMSALALVVLAFALTVAFIIRPTIAASKLKLPKADSGDVPEQLQGIVASVRLGGTLDVGLLLVVLLLMVGASNGGF